MMNQSTGCDRMDSALLPCSVIHIIVGPRHQARSIVHPIRGKGFGAARRSVLACLDRPKYSVEHRRVIRPTFREAMTVARQAGPKASDIPRAPTVHLLGQVVEGVGKRVNL